MSSGKDDALLTLTVFFCGTANTINPPTTQIGTFAGFTYGIDLSQETSRTAVKALKSGERHFKCSFDGVGVTNGCAGTLFAYGLKAQCMEVKEIVEMFITTTSGSKLRLNAVGLSRGGIAVLYLIQMLAEIPRDILELNALLFDPVPGNLIATAKLLDWCHITTANQCMDVSDSRNLSSVLAIYPHQPLPDIAFHAPVFAKYPPPGSGCVVEEDAHLGCHQGALFQPGSSLNDYRSLWAIIVAIPLEGGEDLASTLSFIRIKDFLLDHGTTFNRQGQQFIEEISPYGALRDIEQHLQECRRTTKRYGHSARCGSIVLRHSVAQYLNKHHRQMIERYGSAELTETAYSSRGGVDLTMGPHGISQGVGARRLQNDPEPEQDGNFLLTINHDVVFVPVRCCLCWMVFVGIVLACVLASR